MFTTTAITAFRNFLKSSIASARYKVGSTYYTANIESADVLTDGRVAISFMIDPTASGTDTVTEIQLLDRNNVPWVTSVESISRNPETGNYYLFRCRIVEA